MVTEAIAWGYVGFIIGLIFHRWMEVKGYSDDFWYGFTFQRFLDRFRK